MERFVKPIISNYYGPVEVYTKDDKYYLTLRDWDVYYGVEISKDLAVAIRDYFKETRMVEELDLKIGFY